ncbi:MAG: efflux transporter outer membrane subunit [Phycisphaerales bacterium]
MDTLPTQHKAIQRTVLCAGLLVTLTGCTVGPNYIPPVQAVPGAWTGDQGLVSARTVGSAATPSAAEIDRWWTALNDPLLTSLIERADAANLTLAQAGARLRQARAARAIAASAQSPQVSFATSASRSESSGNTRSLFRAGFDASWEVDLFGGVRRSVEAADADLLAAGYDREDARVSLSAEVATTYLEVRSAQRQMAIARQNLDVQQQTLALTQLRNKAGFVSGLDVASARGSVAQTEAQIPASDAQARTSIYALSVLLGLEPGALLEELGAEGGIPPVPAQVPVGLPSDLLLRRPDLRRADAQLHAATARVGVAMSDQYPRLSLTGSLGTQGDKVPSLGTLADRFWSVGPSLSVPLWTGGRTRAAIEQSQAGVEQAVLAYRQAVLGALQDVETSLANYTREQQRAAALEESVAANREALDLSTRLYRAGKTDFLSVLSAQRQLYATEAQLSQSRTSVATDLVALFKALGGGWKSDGSAATTAEHPPVSTQPGPQ